MYSNLGDHEYSFNFSGMRIHNQNLSKSSPDYYVKCYSVASETKSLIQMGWDKELGHKRSKWWDTCSVLTRGQK